MENTPMQLIWGNDVLDAGFTSKPNIITRYALRYINYGEYAFIDCLCSYKHNASNPFPKQETIAKDMATTDRQIRKWISSLEEKGFLEVEYIYRDDKRVTSAYNFSGLLSACLETYKAENEQEMIKNHVVKVKKQPKKSIKSTTGTKSPVPSGTKSPVPTGTKSPVGSGQNVPLIIDNKNRQLEIDNKNKQPITNELDYLIKTVLKDEKDLGRIEIIKTVFELYKNDITIFEFKGILIGIAHLLPNVKTKGLQSYLSKCIQNTLKPQIAPVIEMKKPNGRKEMLPNWFDQPYEQKALSPQEQENIAKRKAEIDKILKSL